VSIPKTILKPFGILGKFIMKGIYSKLNMIQSYE
jgi:hypothetical protein